MEGAPSSAMDSSIRVFFATADLPLCSSRDGRVEEFRKTGKQPLIFTKSQHHKRLNVFGWVNPIEGTHGMVRQEKANTDGFLAMLKNILLRYQRVVIDLWVDQARWHKGKRIMEFLSYHRRLAINYIPSIIQSSTPKRCCGEPCDMRKQRILIMRHLKNWCSQFLSVPKLVFSRSYD
jgi:hypothetical protein